MNAEEINAAKQTARERMWALLEHEHAVPEPGVHGRIPNFNGAAEAAALLASLPAWKAARVIKAVPDRAQLPVRQRALEDGKTVYMAAPKLAAAKPFYLLDPQHLTVPPAEAAAKEGAARFGQPVDLEEMQPVDLVICGSVAVDRRGVRLGKGAGYSDIEVALLQEAGLIGPHTTIVTTVHALQVSPDGLPTAGHDFSVDIIVTPDEIIHCSLQRRPMGLIWEDLPLDKIAAIPALKSRATHATPSQHSYET